MNSVFSKIFLMSIDSVWLMVAVIIVRSLLQKAPKYFRKILWSLVGLRLIIPLSVESVFSLVPQKVPQTVDKVTEQVVAMPIEKGLTSETIVPVFWLAVAIIFFAYGIISYIRLKLKVIDSIKVKNNVYQSEKIQSPFVCGFIKPKIYVPYGLDEITQKCVLKHEETHIKYADHIIKVIGFVVLCVHWFNPLVWISYFMFCKDIELSCDESVVRNFDSDGCKQYAKALLDLGVNKVKFTACPVAFGEVSIKTRIKSVINYKKASKILVLASLGVCVVISLCFMTEPKTALKESVEEIDVLEETTEPASESETEPTTEPVTEPVTEITIEPETDRAIQQSQTVETTEEVFDDSMFEKEDSGIEYDPLNKINVQEPDLVDPPDPTSPYEGVSYNNFGSNSSVIGNSSGNTVELPTVSLPADPTPTVNYHHTRPYNQFDPNQQFYMW